MTRLAFSPPSKRRVILKRDVWVKGKGLPEKGICLLREGEEVWMETENGSEWFLLGWYKGRKIKVATMKENVS